MFKPIFKYLLLSVHTFCFLLLHIIVPTIGLRMVLLHLLHQERIHVFFYFIIAEDRAVNFFLNSSKEIKKQLLGVSEPVINTIKSKIENINIKSQIKFQKQCQWWRITTSCILMELRCFHKKTQSWILIVFLLFWVFFLFK